MNNFYLLGSTMTAITAALGLMIVVAWPTRFVRRGSIGALSFSLGIALFLGIGTGMLPGLDHLATAQDSGGDSSAKAVEAESATVSSSTDQVVEATEEPTIQPRVVIP